jgi:hypothetical protein
MFDDQTIDLLPARTTMTKCGCGGYSRGGRGGDAAIVQGSGSGNTRQGFGLVQVSALNGNSVNLNGGNATGGNGGWAF